MSDAVYALIVLPSTLVVVMLVLSVAGIGSDHE